MDQVKCMVKPEFTKVTVRASARLHLGFLDLHGGLGRIYGSLGVSLQEPVCVVEVNSKESGLLVSGEQKERVTPIVNQFVKHFGISQGLQVTVWESIPEHVGLGSGTQLGLALGTGISKLIGANVSTRELASILLRGVVSGIGTATFASGGFVVDGGKVTKELQSHPDMVPPMIIRQEIPSDWNFVVALPGVSKGLSGVRESKAFQNLPAAKPDSAQIASRLLVMKLLPAIIDDDIDQFGDALTNIQILVGDAFAPTQGGRFASSEVADCVNAMLDAGAKGAGQSSWGPACYGLVRGTKAAKEVKKVVLEQLDGDSNGPVFISQVNNQGALVTMD